MIQNFRKKYPEEETFGHVFDKNYLEQILNQPTCNGIRIYYALDEHDKRELIIMGIDSENNDIIHFTLPDNKINEPSQLKFAAGLSSKSLFKPTGGEEHALYTPSMPCPDLCGKKNLL